MDLKKFKTTFDEEFSQYIIQKITHAQTLIQYKNINNFLGYLQKYIFSGGKRIRPYVFYMSYFIFQNKPNTEIFTFSMVFEIIHTMALVHDDIIDLSNKRHNVDTVHQYINKSINHIHLAQSQAILI